MFEAVEISREITGSGQNLLLCGDAYQQQPALSALAGQVQAVYIDPPFMTGETFTRRRRFGTSGWKTGRPMPEYPAYIDRFADTREYLELLRSLIECAKDLLLPTGVLYLHLDWRTSAYARLLCDEIFGEDMFLNEIVWSYESGGMQPARRQPSRRMVRKKHPASWWVITLLMSLVVCYGLFVGTKAIYERVVNSAVVDEYIGMDVSAAQRKIQRAGLRPEIMEINHPTIKAGEVILQAPQEGTTLRKNDVVVLTVSKGPSTQTVPKITNLTVSDAITTLSPYGLTLTIVEYVVSATVPAGRIISQSPEEGSVCMSGDAVSVSVSGGMAVVPNVYGRHLADAQELIAASGLSLNQNITFLETDDTTMHGLVAQQSPSGGSEVIASAKVSLTLYRVPSMMARAKVLLSLPQTESMMHVRVTLVESGVEYTAYEGDFPANASREPEVELCGNEPGMYTYRVYCDGEFAYQQQVNME